MKKVVHIGIMPFEKYKQRTLDIAAGRYKPKANEPKLWFTSLKVAGEILNDKNLELLSIIRDRHPESMSELAELTGRAVPNVSRTLYKMQDYGLVKLEKRNHSVRPVAVAERFELRAII